MHRLAVVLSTLLPLAGCPAPAGPSRTTGNRCTVAADCPAALCQDVGTGGLVCTEHCDAESACPTRFVCSEGICIGACTDGATRGDGATRERCVDRLFVACSSLDPIEDCSACGCAPFGGGVCIAGRGCVPPQPDGASCGVAAECISGVCYGDTDVCGPPRADGEACAVAADCASPICYSDTHTCGPPRADGSPCASASECESDSCLSDGLCGAPRAMGGACHVDADCEDVNCSTDGNETATGHCNQPLGSECESFDTPTCTNCIGEDRTFGFFGYCSRRLCDPVDADHCPRTRDRVWECVPSTDGMSRCYETCTGTSYRCLDAFDFCDRGYCQ